jgi:hypothetical protein
MQAQDYATVAVAVLTIIGGFVAAVKWLVKHYLNELKPNSGSSMRDEITGLKHEVAIIKDLVVELVRKQ